MRKTLYAHLQPRIVADATPVLMKSACQHVFDILDDPTNQQEHAKRYLAAVIMLPTYGKYPRHASRSPPEMTWSSFCRICDDAEETAQPAREEARESTPCQPTPLPPPRMIRQPPARPANRMLHHHSSHTQEP
ncbi:hypothetical protein BD779DRAFT_1685718 [Infundibulicybe gibba]|nr:hypothetical protein BD779DRAFT_1685718 [Infundibulicybe gibba]